MLTVLLATARGPMCFTHHPEWNQFEVLDRQLSKQTYRDFELVVVTPFIEQATSALSHWKLKAVEPRSTPWRREKMFAVASARNTGLVHAKGAWVVVIDDCVELGSDFLARIVEYADRQTGVAVMYKKEGGQVIDPRWSRFLLQANNKDSIILRGSMGPTPYGFVSFPMNAAIAVNGYDELRFDGARGLEDMNFARRLMLKGVSFAMDRRIMATLHDHLGYPPEIIDNEAQNARCCNTAHHLAIGNVVANKSRYTAEQKRQVLNCMFWKGDGRCGFHGKPCAYPNWAERGHPIARRILENDEEELFDLSAAQREIGL